VELRDGEHVGTLVLPSGEVAGGVVVAHGGQDDGRRFFLDEAASLAAHGYAVLLPVTRLPDHGDIAATTAAIERSVRTYRWALDALAEHTDRFGFFGHSAGAFLGTRLAVADPRVSAYVLEGYGSGTGVRLAGDQPAAYLSALERFDPRHSLPRRYPSRVLVQCGHHDDAVRRDEALAMYAAAGPDAVWAEYDCGHALDTPQARADRLAFLSGSRSDQRT
jgi:pimeloyl-ACP methyl ester carboxylesterase